MLNFIKMNFYRFFKTRVFYITLLITVLTFGLLARLETDPSSQDRGEQVVQENQEEEHVGIVANEEITEQTSFEDLYASLTSSGYILIMVGVFAIVYTEEERKSGFLKNLLTTHKKKKNIFISKIPVVFLYTLIMFVGSLLAIRLGSLGRGPGMYAIQSFCSLMRFMLFEVILHTVFGIAMMALYEITRNTIIPIMITIFGSANLHGMLLNMVEVKLVSMRPALRGFMEKYALSRNLIVTKVNMLGEAPVDFPYMNVIIVIMIGLVLYSVMGMLIFTKRDTI